MGMTLCAVMDLCLGLILSIGYIDWCMLMRHEARLVVGLFAHAAVCFVVGYESSTTKCIKTHLFLSIWPNMFLMLIKWPNMIIPIICFICCLISLNVLSLF